MATGEDWDIEAFFQAFSSAISVEEESTNLAEKLRGPAVNLEELESAGSVSDFDNPWTDDAADDETQSTWDGGTTTTLVSQKKPKARWFFFVIPILLITSLLWLIWPTASTAVSTPQANPSGAAPSSEVVRRAVLPSHEEILRASTEKSGEVKSEPVSIAPNHHTKVNQSSLVDSRLDTANPRP